MFVGLNGHNLGLFERQVLGALERVLHIGAVFDAVGLGPQRVYGRAFAAVEHAVLDAGRVGRPPHLAAQRIDLTHKVALGRAADGRVAGHVADRVQIDGKAQGTQPQARAGQRGLDARVPRANDGNVICASKIHGSSSGLFVHSC